MAFEKSTGRLSFWEKAGYGFGDLASVLYWQTISSYLLYFYTDVFGITAAAAGTMILVTRMWDGVNDPLMGIIADRTNTRWGKFRPYLLWMSVPLAIMGVLTFSVPDFGYSGKLIYAYVTFTLFMMLYTAINIPYSSLLGVITPDSVERTSVASFKYTFAFASGILVSAIALPLATHLDKSYPGKGWSITMAIFGAFAVVFFLVTFLSTKERVQPPPKQKTSIKQDLLDLAANRPWLILLIATMLIILFVATRMSVTTHYFKYYVGTQTLSFLGKSYTFEFDVLTSAFNTVGQAFAFLGVIATAPMARLFGKKRAFLILFVLAALSTAVFYFLKPEHLLLIFLFQILNTFSSGPLTPLLWAMYADTADYSEWKNGRRATGLVFSASTMSQKFGWAIGTAFAGWLMSFFGFKANIVQSDQVQHGIVMLMSVIPAALGALSILVMYFYKLDDKTMEQIQAELEARRTSE
ncbi:MAG TPA: MFS transporter [Caldithrix abyssi]|uniref:MFS transporter n=1 Tax=Caldithrix abyssi TaxID=187145 RepID=A0A7V5LJA8_CALAY|nr:MFS transporter [Caldithrix abyssi]